MKKVLAWVDSSQPDVSRERSAKPDWLRIIPFIALHLACLFVIVVGWSWFAVGFAVFSYLIRMFAITAFYHRYFSHRAFRTSRPVQFLFAVLGASATQRGPLWWAAHHREHHKHSDTDQDVHSPVTNSFFWSHMGWFLSTEHFDTREDNIRDFNRYPELRWLNKYDILVPFFYALAILLFGFWLESAFPELGTGGWQLLIWGYFISTVVLTHATLCINSLAHRLGRRTYDTDDDSRNNLLLAVITLGEGWHNNHHHFPASTRQGFRWWQIDISYYVLKGMEKLGLVWDLKKVPESKLRDKS